MNVQAKKNPGRKRRATGWTLLVLGLLVAGVWVASGYGERSSRWGANVFSVGFGEVSYEYLAGTESAALSRLEVRSLVREMISDAEARSGLPSWQLRTLDTREPLQGWVWVTASFWPVPLLLWTPAALLLRSGILARRRAMTGNCAACGYSLAGLPPGVDAKCPECGKGAGTK